MVDQALAKQIRTTPATIQLGRLVLAFSLTFSLGSAGCSGGDDDGNRAAPATATSTPSHTSTATATATQQPTATATGIASPTPGNTPDPAIEAIIRLIVANGPSYGEVNPDQVRRILTIKEDRPFHMFNLIRYREHALYPDGSDANLSGREADERYGQAVLPILESIGASVAFTADVGDTLIGDDEWDVVAVARYPSRAAFFSLVQRADFQAASVHKEAGVERSIVIVTEDVSVALPPGLTFNPESAPFPPTEADPVRAVIHLIRYNGRAMYADGRRTTLTGRQAMALYETATAPRALPLGIRPALTLEVEGVFVGDGREWDEARINLFPSRETFDELNAAEGREDDFEHRVAAIDETYALMTFPGILP